MLDSQPAGNNAEFLLKQMNTQLKKSSLQQRLVEIIEELVVLHNALSRDDDEKLAPVIRGALFWIVGNFPNQEFSLNTHERYSINFRTSSRGYGILGRYEETNLRYNNFLQLASFFGINGGSLKNRLFASGNPLKPKQLFWTKKQRLIVKKMIKDTLDNIFSVVDYIKKAPETRTCIFFEQIQNNLCITDPNNLSCDSSLRVICLNDIFGEAVNYINQLSSLDPQIKSSTAIDVPLESSKLNSEDDIDTNRYQIYESKINTATVFKYGIIAGFGLTIFSIAARKAHIYTSQAESDPTNHVAPTV